MTAPWAEVFVVHLGTDPISHSGQKRYRQRAELRARMFLPLNEGDQAILAASALFQQTFREVRISGDRFQQPRVESFGREEVPGNGAWWRLDGVAPFFRDVQAPPAGGGAAFQYTTVEGAHSICRARFESKVQVPLQIITIYDNLPPIDHTRTIVNDPAPGTPHVRLTVTTTTPVRAETGAFGTNLIPGVCLAEHFSNVHEGDRPGLQFGDHVAGQFRSTRDGGVSFLTPSVVTVGRVGPWFKTNVHVAFQFEERY